MGVGTGIGLLAIWGCIGLVSIGNINTFWALSGWGFGASVAVIIFV